MSRSSLVVLSALLSLAACGRPGMSVRAPGKIERALTVVDELGAVATLVKSGGAALDGVALTRGDDAVAFSGFLPAEPGQYTLDIVFDGVPAGASERHFLGRLSSDSFTVTQGEAVTPNFSKPVDTLGRGGDGGDEDEDGLGFLDELLLGTDPESSDSDADGVLDGVDCLPGDNASTFAILDGGSFEDCDADGFRSITAPLGEPGTDCDDEDPGVNPGVDDDCATTVDEDCRPQTCPVDDVEGPEITPVTPSSGDTIGCHTRFLVDIKDTSDVQSASLQAPDFPVSGFARTVLLAEVDGTDDWEAAQGFGNTGGGLLSGPLRVVVQATDFRGNSTAVDLDLTLALAFPEVTLSGAAVIGDGPPVDVTLTPAGPRPLASLQLFAAPMNGSGQLDLANEVLLGTVNVAGGTVSVDPSELNGSFVVYPRARDDVGNELAPQAPGAFYNATTGTINASFFCDGVGHGVPAIVRRQNIGPAPMLEHLQEAIDIATGIDPDAYLVKIIGFGMQSDGAIDLSDMRAEFRAWIYGFMTPDRVLDERGISVTWYATGFLFGQTNPVVNEDDGGTFQVDALVHVATYPDSDVVASTYPCGGTGWTGDADGDTLIITRDGDTNEDRLIVSTRDDYNWGVLANDLTTETFGCSCPADVTCP